MLRARQLPDPPAPRRHPPPPRGPVLTIHQIHSRYKSEWILLNNPVTDKNLNVLKGQVVAHSKSRDEVDRRAIELRLKSSAFLYTGQIPDDAAVIL